MTETRPAQRYISIALALAGLGAIAAALLADRLTGQRLTIGWSQLALILGGVIALVASVPKIRTGVASIRERSVEQSPRVLVEMRPAFLLVCSIWFALLVSAIEIGLRTYEKTSGKRILGLQYLWTTPIGYLILFGGLGLIVFAVARRLPIRAAVRLLVFLCTFPALLGWLSLSVKGLHIAAAAVLAAGLAVQLATLISAHAYVLNLLVRRSLVWMIVMLAGVSTTAVVWPHWTESRALAALPPARAGAPNVLLIVLDTVRAQSLGLYGYQRQTSPNLDRFAARGVVFSRAFSTSPWTLPSHGSMFTGRLPHELTGAWQTPIDHTHPTLAEALGRAGYLTAGFVANTTYCPAEFGLARGFAHYEDHPWSINASFLTTSFGSVTTKALDLGRRLNWDLRSGLKDAARMNADVLRWLDQRDSSRPFFAFVNYYDAHAPYVAPPEFNRRFSSTPPRGDVWARRLDQWTASETREFNDAYDSSIAYLDDQLGALLDTLDRQGVLENTVVIITADHGEQFGEHGLLEHANSLYLPLLHVPLVIVSPKHLPAATRIETFVSLRDLASTVLDLTGQSETNRFPGASLARHWLTSGGTRPGTSADFLAEIEQAYDAYPNSYPARKGRMQSLFSGTHHYIRNLGDGREELYDLDSDFAETRDISSRDPLTLSDFRSRLLSLLGERRVP